MCEALCLAREGTSLSRHTQLHVSSEDSPPAVTCQINDTFVGCHKTCLHVSLPLKQAGVFLCLEGEGKPSPVV